MMTDNLEHSGILGMKWGHHKQSGWADKTSAVQRVVKTGGAIKKTPYVKTDKTTSTTPRLTDAQLRARINRIEMEKKYALLTKKEVSPGKKFVTEMLTNIAKQTVTAYTTKYLNKTIESLMNSKTTTANTSRPSANHGTRPRPSTQTPNSMMLPWG